MGQTYDPEHFPCMPVMMKSSTPAIMSLHEPAAADPPATLSQVPEPDDPSSMQVSYDAQASSLPEPISSCLHTCPSCHMSFLTSHGLTVHAAQCPSKLTHQLPSAQQRRMPFGSCTAPVPKTIKQMLALPVADCPQPAKSYTCPICQAQLGRKALVAHLQNVHQAGRPSHFPFHADRDMLPGQLACSHCYSVFTMDLALLTFS